MKIPATAVRLAALFLLPVPPVAAQDDALLAQARQLFRPLPADMAAPGRPLVPAQVELGRKLFFEPRVSVDGTVSCARCHLPQLGASDGLKVSVGALGRPNPRNAPTVYNAALQTAAHWRGDRADVEDQARQALLGKASFGQPSLDAAMSQLAAIPGYPALFRQAFPDDPKPVNADNWARAIGAFERTLVTPAPFDAYLKGDPRALSAQQRRGLQTFINAGCAGCHAGVNLGGESFRKFGVHHPYAPLTGSQKPDPGRFDITKDEADRFVFKVPGLRNVALTPPYFHDGSVPDLGRAVQVMAKTQLDRDLSETDTADLVAFLGSLTGTPPPQFVTAPQLPAAGFSPAKPAEPGAEDARGTIAPAKPGGR